MLPTVRDEDGVAVVTGDKEQQSGAAMAAGGFACRRCGRCCREPGYVYLTEGDVDRIAAFLDMDVEAFTARFARLGQHRRGLSLVEREDGACVFLDGLGACAVQPVKPAQCESFPGAWRYSAMETVCEGWGK